MAISGIKKVTKKIHIYPQAICYLLQAENIICACSRISANVRAQTCVRSIFSAHYRRPAEMQLF
jgi:hypothetical protein